MKQRIARTSLAIGLMSMLVIGMPAAASANTNDGAGPAPSAGGRIETTLLATGFDKEVAQANGFNIVEYDDGSWESVAVSEEAKRQGAETGLMVPASNGESTARGTVYGPCGSSWVDADANGRSVAVVTGYQVTAPVSNRIYWDVTFWTGYGATTLSWGSGPSPAFWQGAGSVLYASSTGGTAIAGGAVILINGTVCGAGLPSDGF